MKVKLPLCTLNREVTVEGITLPAGTVCEIEKDYSSVTAQDERPTLDLLHRPSGTIFWAYKDQVALETANSK